MSTGNNEHALDTESRATRRRMNLGQRSRSRISRLSGALLFIGSLRENVRVDKLKCYLPLCPGRAVATKAMPFQDAPCSIPRIRDSGSQPY